MDLHIIPGVTAKDVAKAHFEDIKIQGDYNCKCMTYWIDEKRDSVFCLIDAPDKESIRELHDKSHGLIPHEIIPVNNNLVQAFLGRLQDPESFEALSDPELKIFNDPAYRIILATQIRDIRLLKNMYGNKRAKKLTFLHNEIVEDKIKSHSGSKVEMTNSTSIISFNTATDALQCARAIQRSFHIAGDLVNLHIGLHAGMPVDNSNILFGKVVKFSQALCIIGNENQIIASSNVFETYTAEKGETIEKSKGFKWLSSSDEKFIKSVFKIININLQNPELSIDDFCKQMSISNSKLYRKCKDITNMSLNSLIREFRLLHALKLLGQNDKNITEIAFDSGFSSPSYFTKCFLKRFGTQPTNFQS